MLTLCVNEALAEFGPGRTGGDTVGGDPINGGPAHGAIVQFPMGELQDVGLYAGVVSEASAKRLYVTISHRRVVWYWATPPSTATMRKTISQNGDV